MFTGQLIGYVGADARANKMEKDFIFMYHQSSKVQEILRTRRFG